jgi:hypothetical protein
MVPSFFSDSSTSSGRTTFDDDLILRLRSFTPKSPTTATHWPPKILNTRSCFGLAREVALSAGTLAGDPGGSPAVEARVRFLSRVTWERREEHALRTSTLQPIVEVTRRPPLLPLLPTRSRRFGMLLWSGCRESQHFFFFCLYDILKDSFLKNKRTPIFFAKSTALWCTIALMHDLNCGVA